MPASGYLRVWIGDRPLDLFMLYPIPSPVESDHPILMRLLVGIEAPGRILRPNAQSEAFRRICVADSVRFHEYIEYRRFPWIQRGPADANRGIDALHFARCSAPAAKRENLHS